MVRSSKHITPKGSSDAFVYVAAGCSTASLPVGDTLLMLSSGSSAHAEWSSALDGEKGEGSTKMEWSDAARNGASSKSSLSKDSWLAEDDIGDAVDAGVGGEKVMGD